MENTMKQYRKVVGVIAALSVFLSPALYAYDQAFADAVANMHIQSFPVIKTDEKPEPSLKMEGWGDLWKMARSKRDLGLKNLGDHEKRELSFKQATCTPINGDVIDPKLVEKLLLVRGDTDRAYDHLMHRITTGSDGKSVLKTTMGAKRFTEMISQVTSDKAIIHQRQSVIRALVENDTLRTQCNALLAKMASVEPYVYDLYARTPESESEKMKVVSSQMGLNGTQTLSVTTRVQEVANGFAMTMPLLVWGGVYFAKNKAKTAANAHRYESELFWSTFAEGLIPTAIFETAFAPLLFVGVVAQSKIQWYTRLNMQERLIGMASYLRSLKKLIYALGRDEIIGSQLPELKQISQQLYYDSNGSNEFNKLNALLAAHTFSEGKPTGFSSPGQVVNAYREVIKENVRKEYAPAMNLLGELDVYVALANKIKAHEGLNAQFCFADFIEESDKPVIKATNFWNPFVAHTVVVGNDISLNTGHERDIILTGPNTGGKSTIMKGLMFSVILAQTFGIAPAQSFQITPFTKLLTYLNIADDTGAGVSLFKAEINRAKEIMETVRALKPNEFAFLITDEMFTGTSPDKGEELSFNFAKQLTEFPNVTFIQATHFKKLTELPQITNGICKNYYTGVIIEDGKVVKYTYTLVPGISPISTAEQIAKEEAVFNF